MYTWKQPCFREIFRVLEHRLRIFPNCGIAPVVRVYQRVLRYEYERVKHQQVECASIIKALEELVPPFIREMVLQHYITSEAKQIQD